MYWPQYRTLNRQSSSILNHELFRILKMKLLQDRLAYVYAQRPTLEGDRGQIGLVKASGASKSMVNQWLSGAVKSIGIEWALQLEANLGFSHVWLMAGLGDPLAKAGQVIILEAPKAEEPLLTLAMPREMALLDLFRRSTDDGQADILGAAEQADKRPAAKIRTGKL